MRPARPNDDGEPRQLIRSVRPIGRVPRAGAWHFASVFTVGGGAVFLFFAICVMSPTPGRHLLLAFGALSLPLVALALLHQTPGLQLRWRRARPKNGHHLTIWERRLRFWPTRKKRRHTSARPPLPTPPPPPDPDSLFVPSPDSDD